jgi:HEAT repeat protein
MQKLLITTILGLALALSPALSFAKKKKSGSRRKAVAAQKENQERTAVPGDVKNAVKNLASRDPDTVVEAVQILGASAHTAAVEPLLNLLKTGPRSDITDSVLFALGSIPGDEAVPVLIEYMNHRRPDARAAAIMALENKKGRSIAPALENALRDSDRQVRAAAALALGARGDTASVPILFTAFERDVPEAAIALGRLGSEKDAERLARYLGKEDIKVLLGGFEEFLKRETFPESGKLDILNRLFDLAGPDVWRFAVTFKSSFPPDTDETENKVYKLVCRMVRQIKDK